MEKLNVAPHFMRLHEWIAQECGFFKDEGLEVEFVKEIMDNYNLTKAPPRAEAESRMTEGDHFVNSACHWGVCNSSAAGIGRVVRDVHSVGDFGIYVLPSSKVRKPEDLADVAIGVGYLAGGHFTALEALQKYVPKDRLKLKFIGGPGRRLIALLNGEVEAANLLGPEHYIAQQKGLRRIVGGTFKVLFWASASIKGDALRRYFNALRKAEEELSRNPDRYRHYWKRNIPEEFSDFDVGKFGLGERLVFEPYSQEEYERTYRFMIEWGLADRMLETRYKNLILRTVE